MSHVEKKEWLEVGPHKHVALIASNGDSSTARYECKDCAACAKTLQRFEKISCPCPCAPDGKHVWREEACWGSRYHDDPGGAIYLHKSRNCVHCRCTAECFGWENAKKIGSGWY